MSPLAPDVPGHLDHEPQLLPLILDGDRIALVQAAEPALRAQGELLERHVPCGLVEAALERVR